MGIKSVAIVLAIVFAAGNAVPYSKFGRSCKDIGCLSSEVCVMAEEPCSYGHQRDQCGRYPTCQRSTSGAETCQTKICPSGQYCRTDNGRPTCVNTNAALGYDSAGVSSVNGQKLPSGGEQPPVPADPYGSRYAGGNQYANANAPAAEDVLGGNRQPSYGNNNAYPAYPATTNSNNNNYPAYPSSSSSSSNNNNNNNNGGGYPPYPTNNNNNNGGYPPYPSNSNSGYPPYPINNNRPGGEQYGSNRLPQHNPGWNNIYPGSIYNRKNGASTSSVSISLLVVTSLLGSLIRIIKA